MQLFDRKSLMQVKFGICNSWHMLRCCWHRPRKLQMNLSMSILPSKMRSRTAINLRTILIKFYRIIEQMRRLLWRYLNFDITLIRQKKRRKLPIWRICWYDSIGQGMLKINYSMSCLKSSSVNRGLLCITRSIYFLALWFRFKWVCYSWKNNWISPKNSVNIFDWH